jgi:hypothetical protein
VRLTRRGEDVTAFRSADGKYWQWVDAHHVPMGRKVLVGVAAWTTGNAWTGSAVIDSVRVVPGTPGLSYFPGGDSLMRGVVMRDGNVVVADVVSVDAMGLRYERDGQTSVVPTERVARLVFAPVPPDFAPDKPGILLAGGDFAEGEVAGVSVQPVEWPRKPQLKAAVRSVLFGTRTFEVAREVIAVDFAAVTPSEAKFEVRTGDGSVMRAMNVEVKGEAVMVDGKAVPDVTEVRRL